MTDPYPKAVEQYIKNATVKIFADGKFSGTGFFISADGYLLTAYHCVENAQSIRIETPYDGKFPATLHPDKSLSDPRYDLAVLKAEHRPSHFLPLGVADESQVSDNIVVVGYPASHLAYNERVGIYKGHISRWRDDNRIELSDSVKGQGQSGSAVYHYRSHRVLGVAVERYKEAAMVDAGRAVRLNLLFEKWPALQEINRNAIKRWDELLQQPAPTESRHPIIFGIFPENNAYRPLHQAVRQVVEERWGCQLLTLADRQYSDTLHDNLRHHLERAHAFIAETSAVDPQVMLMLGAAWFHYNRRPTVLLSRAGAALPPALRGRAVAIWKPDSPSLADDLHHHLAKITALQRILDDPAREHFLSVAALQRLTRIPLPQETWLALHAQCPTRETWQQCDETVLRSLLGADADLAPVLLKRILKEMQ